MLSQIIVLRVFRGFFPVNFLQKYLVFCLITKLCFITFYSYSGKKNTNSETNAFLNEIKSNSRFLQFKFIFNVKNQWNN